jgi:transposase
MGKPCQLSAAEQQKIDHWITAHGTPQQVALRCRIVSAAAAGVSDVAIAQQLSVNRNTVILWRQRFADQGLDALWEIAPGRGRKPLYSIDKVAAIVEATLQTKPAGMTHWSCRTLAQSQGVSKSTVNNIWRAHNLQPHRTKTFKLSRDPKFLEKMTDVVGLYLNPPQQAIVLCVDEKSQIQALDRTQPGLPIKRGRCSTMTHDYKRNGTTTLFAALETLQGKVVGECHERHRHQEFLKFLRRLDTEFPGEVPLHLILDNYGTHKHAKVKAWMKRHPRFVLHFVPTSSSWMNLVERWFGHLDNQAIRRGVFLSVADLEASIAAFLKAWNQNPKPFVWTATVESIQEKLHRCRRTLEKIQPGSTRPKSRKRKR